MSENRQKLFGITEIAERMFTQFIELGGFGTWWILYLYVLKVLWAVTMLLAKKLSKKVQSLVCMVVNACHGFLFGVLYAQSQALLFGLSFEGMLAWIVAGLPFDFIHGVSNFFCGMLIVPKIQLLKRLKSRAGRE